MSGLTASAEDIHDPHSQRKKLPNLPVMPKNVSKIPFAVKKNDDIVKGHNVSVNISDKDKAHNDSTGTGHQEIPTHMATPELPGKPAVAAHKGNNQEGVVKEGNNVVAGPDPKVASGGDRGAGGKSLRAGHVRLTNALTNAKSTKGAY